MANGARILKGSDGRERVVLELAEFQALLDAARQTAAGLPEVAPLVRKLDEILRAPREEVDLDRFLADYDAAHGESS
jgi:hypothetical protein